MATYNDKYSQFGGILRARCLSFAGRSKLLGEIMRALRMSSFGFVLIFLFSFPAFANSCDPFATYTCSKSTPNLVRLVGTGTTGQSVGILLGSNSFSLTFKGNASFTGDDLILLAAFPGAMGGSVNGASFTSLSSFPEQGAIGAIQSTWAGLGISFNNSTFGYANLGTISGSSFAVTASGVPTGTIFYGEVVNPTSGKILYITPNSEAGILVASTPEPGSLTLLGMGLVGLAGVVRKKTAKA